MSDHEIHDHPGTSAADADRAVASPEIASGPDRSDRRPGPGDDASEPSGSDAEFARVVEQITRRLQVGEDIDEARLAEDYPAWAETIGGLMPTLRELAELGRVVEDHDGG